MENRQVSVRIRLRKPEGKTLLVSAIGNAAETRWKHFKRFSYQKRRTFSPFFSYTFPVVSDLWKRNGNVNCQVSVNFPNYGNALFPARNPEFITASSVTHTQQSKALPALTSAWKLYCNDKHHDSKMALWLWLQNETCNGCTCYRLGNQCSLEGIIHSLHHYMSEEERKFFSFVTSVSRKCARFSDHKFKVREQRSGTFKIVVDEIIPEDRTDPSDPQSSISLAKYFERHTMPGGYSCLSGKCDYKYQVGDDDGKTNTHLGKCNQPALRTMSITQILNLIIF